MTNYHPDPQRAYESHCADAYLVEDDETTPQEPTGGAVSDVPRDQAPGGGGGLREAVEALADEWDNPLLPFWGASLRLKEALAAHPAPTGDVIERAVARIRPVLGPFYDGKASQAVFALAAAGLLFDPQREVAWLRKVERRTDERDRAREECGHEKAMRKFVGEERDTFVKLYLEAKAERDRARDTAARLEAENARLTEALRARLDALPDPDGEDGEDIPVKVVGSGMTFYRDGYVEALESFADYVEETLAALSDTTGEATR